jgi:hypothetical protein
MRKRSLAITCVWLLAGLLLGGCEEEPTGACVSDLGGPTIPGCMDGQKARECDFGFTEYYEGVTCAELGFEMNIVDGDTTYIGVIFLQPSEARGIVGP